VGHLASSRFVIDQPGQPEFNRERVLRSRDRAFVPFLLALLQRLMLERVRQTVAQTVRAASGRDLLAVREDLQRDRRDLLEFVASAFFTNVSSRDEYNRYYLLAQRGLRVREAYRVGTDAVAQLDRACSSEERSQTSRNTAATLQESYKLQTRLEWVEVFVVSFYAFHFAGILGELFHVDAGHVGWWAVAAAAAALLVTLAGLKPWRHGPSSVPGSRTASALPP
jgi:hypothetical protein